MKISISENIHVNAPVTETFLFLTDPKSRKRIIPLLEEIIFLDDNPLQVGSKYVEISTIVGRRFETTYMVVVFDENKQISVVTVESVFPIRVDLILKKELAGTTISLDMTLQLKGVFAFGSPVVKNIVTQQAREILRKTKQILEN
jgi:carbon monoxide dehydrogenase subunit G